MADMMIIAGYIGTAIVGGLLGWFLSGMLVNYKKMIDKKRALKRIGKQKQDIFHIPKDGVQEKVSLREYVGLDAKQEEVEADKEYNKYISKKK